MMRTNQTQHTLIVNSGPNMGQSYIIHDVVSTIGRSADNTIVLDSSQVSRHHAKITILPSGAVIEDTGSTNGTFVNGQRITTQYQLSSGDTVGITDYISFQYVAEGVTGAVSDFDPSPGRPTVIMDHQDAFGQADTPAPTPQIESQIPDFQSNVYTPPPADAQSGGSMKPDSSRKNPTTLYIIIAVLVVLICFCVAISIFLWFAPEAFWRDLFDFFNIPWPSQPMFLS